MGRWPSLVAFLALAVSTLPADAARPGAPGGRPFAADFAAQILAGHNRARSQLGIAPVAWDPLLAQSAAAYAQQMAATRLFVHSDRRGRPGIGENLWSGQRGSSVQSMLGLWLAEGRNFIPGIFPNTSRTGNWFDVSHFTQMIWPTTTRVGCGLASNGGSDYLVCRYSPKGNVDGRAIPAGGPRRP